MKRDRILIVDDEANIRFVLKTALETENYAVTEAVDGREAMDRIRVGVARNDTFDLILLDLNMPGMDGMAVLEQVTAMPANVRPRVVVLTAFGSIATAVKATRLGASDFLEKPVLPAALREVIRGVLDEVAPHDIATGHAPQAAFEQVLDRVRHSLRSDHFEDAEALLVKAADRRERNAAEQFNLLGVLYESQRSWRLAKKFYGKAIAADGKYEPAQTNMQRMYELFQFGRSERPVLLGDESDALAMALDPHLT